MIPMRTVVFSPYAEQIEKSLTANPACRILASFSAETDIFSFLLANPPDLVILDEAFPGTDIYHLMRRMQESLLMPKVLLIGAAALENCPADGFLPFPFTEDEVSSAAQRLAAAPLSALMLANEERLLAVAKECCRALGMAEKLKGTAYLSHCAAWLLSLPPFTPMSGLYALLSRRFSISSASAERCIRTAIEQTWLHGHMNTIDRFFGNTVDADKGKPTNAEFITGLSQCIRNTIQSQSRG